MVRVRVMVRRVLVAAIALIAPCVGGVASAAKSPDKLEILSALERGDHAGLEQRIGALQEQADRDPTAEVPVQVAFEAFGNSRPELEPLLVAWVKRSPRSYVAQMALATYYARAGWAARGGKYARETSSDRFAGMNRSFAKAIEGASAAIALHPTMAEAYSLLINVAMARGEEEREAELVRRALQQVPKSFRVRRTVMQTLRPRWGGSYPAMQAFAEESQRHAKENPRLHALRGMVAWDMGTLAVDDKNFGGAVLLFARALEAGPHDEFYASRADAYLRMHDPQKALADANQALLLHPQVADVLADRAQALGNAGHFEVAVADVELALKLAPEDDRVHYARDSLAGRLIHAGCDLETAGKYDEALARFDEAVRISPAKEEVYYRRGRTYIQKGKLDRAKDDLERAIDLNPRYFDAYRTLDWLLAKNGRWDDVIGRWNQFIALEPRNANAYLERAGSHRHKGDMRSALSDLKSACDLGNGNACQILASQTKR